jgi:hypothetical protein
VHQGDRGRRVGPRVAVEVLEIVDPAARGDGAGELARRGGEAARDREEVERAVAALQRLADEGLAARVSRTAWNAARPRALLEIGGVGSSHDRRGVALRVVQREAVGLHQADRLLAQQRVQLGAPRRAKAPRRCCSARWRRTTSTAWMLRAACSAMTRASASSSRPVSSTVVRSCARCRTRRGRRSRR